MEYLSRILFSSTNLSDDEYGNRLINDLKEGGDVPQTILQLSEFSKRSTTCLSDKEVIHLLIHYMEQFSTNESVTSGVLFTLSNMISEKSDNFAQNVDFILDETDFVQNFMAVFNSTDKNKLKAALILLEDLSNINRTLFLDALSRIGYNIYEIFNCLSFDDNEVVDRFLMFIPVLVKDSSELQQYVAFNITDKLLSMIDVEDELVTDTILCLLENNHVTQNWFVSRNFLPKITPLVEINQKPAINIIIELFSNENVEEFRQDPSTGDLIRALIQNILQHGKKARNCEALSLMIEGNELSCNLVSNSIDKLVRLYSEDSNSRSSLRILFRAYFTNTNNSSRVCSEYMQRYYNDYNNSIFDIPTIAILSNIKSRQKFLGLYEKIIENISIFNVHVLIFSISICYDFTDACNVISRHSNSIMYKILDAINDKSTDSDIKYLLSLLLGVLRIYSDPDNQFLVDFFNKLDFDSVLLNIKSRTLNIFKLWDNWSEKVSDDILEFQTISDSNKQDSVFTESSQKDVFNLHNKCKEYEIEISSQKQEIEKLKTELTNLQLQYQSEISQNSSLENELSKIKLVQNATNFPNEQSNDAVIQLNELQEKFAEEKKLRVECEQQIKILKEELTNLHQSSTENSDLGTNIISEELNEERNRNAELQRELESLRRELSLYKQKQTSSQEGFENSSEMEFSTKDQAEKDNYLKEELYIKESIIAEKDQRLCDLEQKLMDMESTISEILAENKELSDMINLLEKENNDLKESIRNNEELINNIELLEKENNELKESIRNNEELINNIELLEKENNELKESIRNNEELINNIELHKNENTELKESIRNNEELINNIELLKKENTELKESIKNNEELINKVELLEKENNELKESIRNNEELINNIELLKNENNELKERLAESENIICKINFLEQENKDLKEKLGNNSLHQMLEELQYEQNYKSLYLNITKDYDDPQRTNVDRTNELVHDPQNVKKELKESHGVIMDHEVDDVVVNEDNKNLESVNSQMKECIKELERENKELKTKIDQIQIIGKDDELIQLRKEIQFLTVENKHMKDRLDRVTDNTDKTEIDVNSSNQSNEPGSTSKQYNDVLEENKRLISDNEQLMQKLSKFHDFDNKNNIQIEEPNEGNLEEINRLTAINKENEEIISGLKEQIREHDVNNEVRLQSVINEYEKMIEILKQEIKEKDMLYNSPQIITEHREGRPSDIDDELSRTLNSVQKTTQMCQTDVECVFEENNEGFNKRYEVQIEILNSQLEHDKSYIFNLEQKIEHLEFQLSQKLGDVDDVEQSNEIRNQLKELEEHVETLTDKRKEMIEMFVQNRTKSESPESHLQELTVDSQFFDNIRSPSKIADTSLQGPAQLSFIFQENQNLQNENKILKKGRKDDEKTIKELNDKVDRLENDLKNIKVMVPGTSEDDEMVKTLKERIIELEKILAREQESNNKDVRERIQSIEDEKRKVENLLRESNGKLRNALDEISRLKKVVDEYKKRLDLIVQHNSSTHKYDYLDCNNPDKLRKIILHFDRENQRLTREIRELKGGPDMKTKEQEYIKRITHLMNENNELAKKNMLISSTNTRSGQLNAYGVDENEDKLLEMASELNFLRTRSKIEQKSHEDERKLLQMKCNALSEQLSEVSLKVKELDDEKSNLCAQIEKLTQKLEHVNIHNNLESHAVQKRRKSSGMRPEVFKVSKESNTRIGFMEPPPDFIGEFNIRSLVNPDGGYTRCEYRKALRLIGKLWLSQHYEMQGIN